MQVRDGMTETPLTIGPQHTLREAAEVMCRRHVGAAVVMDPDGQGPAVITERDILRSVGAGQDPTRERVADHLTADAICAAPDWSLEKAAATMVKRGFRHLLVLEAGELVGILSMRDIVRVWSGEGASCEVPDATGAVA